MHLDLAGRVVLVTGGSRGIGRAVAQALVAEGARVAITLTGVWADRAQALADAEGLDFEAAKQAILDRRGLGHAQWATADDIADVIVFLLSRAARFVNGTVLRVDGGQSPRVDY